MSVESCKNCGRLIGKLEQAFLFNNNVVCSECYSKLNQVQSTKGEDAVFNIKYMQLKKSVGMALLLNFLWAGSGIYYVKCPKGRFIIWLTMVAFAFGVITSVFSMVFLPCIAFPPIAGLACFALFLWSSDICYNYIQIYNYELLEALRTDRLSDFNKKYAHL